MQLTLESKEQEILGWALKSIVSDLGEEIVKTENHDYREDLKERKAVLLGLLHRLGLSAAAQ